MSSTKARSTDCSLNICGFQICSDNLKTRRPQIDGVSAVCCEVTQQSLLYRDINFFNCDAKQHSVQRNRHNKENFNFLCTKIHVRTLVDYRDYFFDSRLVRSCRKAININDVFIGARRNFFRGEGGKTSTDKNGQFLGAPKRANDYFPDFSTFYVD